MAEDRSQPAEEVVLSLDLSRYIAALRKYSLAILAFVAAALTFTVFYTNTLPRVYEAKASIQIEPRLPEYLGAAPVNNGLEFYKQQREVLSSYTLVRQTVEQHDLYLRLLTDFERTRSLDEQIELATRRMMKQLSIKYPEQNRIMFVLVRNEDAELATDIANDHVATYLAYTKGQLSTDTRQTSNALQNEFDAAEPRLRDAEAALFKFQRDNNLLANSLEDRQNLVTANINAYSLKLSDARSHRIEIGARLDQMRKAAAKDVLESPVLLVGESTSFDPLRAQYYTERNKFLEVEKELGPKHAEYQKQKAKVEDLYAALKTEAQRMIDGVEQQYLAAQATEKAFGAEIERYKQEALALGPVIVQYNELVRKKKSIEDRYTILRTRLSTSEVSDRMNTQIDTSFASKLDPARVPTDPVSPSLRLNLMVGGMLALMLGIGVVVLLVFFDRTIKRTLDAEQAGGAPVLGIIPMLAQADLPANDDRARDRYVHEHPASQVAECCRSLRTNIMFSAADRALKTIIVSSANPREGKTTSVIYLGTTMAQAGQRVLLIDTDMRRPRLHASLQVSRQPSLLNLIIGDATHEEAIKPTDIPNLFVLPCGPLPPNPAELIMSKRFEVVLRELEARFDRIILDSPPVQAVTDAVILSKITDAVVLVARANKTLRDDIKRSAKQIRDVGGTVTGLIVNDLDQSGRDYYYNYYGYRPDKADADVAA